MVIQRWQTVMLLVSTVLMVLCLCLPLGDVTAFDILPLFIVGVLSGVFSLFAIFMFRQLDLQKRLVLLASLFAAVAMVAAALTAVWQAFIWLAPSFVLDVWAYVRVKADQNLLRSYDRIR